MSLWRHHETWVAISLGIFIFSGLRLIGSQIQEADALIPEESASYAAAQTGRPSLGKARDGRTTKPRGAIEDDISLADIETLVKHPNYEIRRAAIKIMLHRFKADKFCMSELRKDYIDEDGESRKGPTDAASNRANTLIELASEYDIHLLPMIRDVPQPMILDWTIPDGGDNHSEGESSDEHDNNDISNDHRDDQVQVRDFLRTARGFLNHFVETIEGESREEIDLEQSRRILSNESVEQSPEEIALEHRRRREAMVIENEAGDGRVEIIMPHDVDI